MFQTYYTYRVRCKENISNAKKIIETQRSAAIKTTKENKMADACTSFRSQNQVTNTTERLLTVLPYVKLLIPWIHLTTKLILSLAHRM